MIIDCNCVNFLIFVYIFIFLQLMLILKIGDENRFMLVIVQNLGVLDFVFIDKFKNKLDLFGNVFKMLVNIQRVGLDLFLLLVIEYDSQQFQLMGDFFIIVEFGNCRDNYLRILSFDCCDWEFKFCMDFDD